MRYAIEVTTLAKAYGDHHVLRDLDLAVPTGSVFALLGPNGAGKTTTVRILATLLRPDAGTVRVAGHDVVAERAAVRRAISLTGQSTALDALLTGEENLRVIGRLAGLGRAGARARAAELLARFGLDGEPARRPVSTYSGGMRRRLDLAAGLVTEPAVVFLDEPTTGLDPRSRQDLWAVVGDLAARGVTVFLTTQYLEEADRLADRIGVVDGGRLVAEGTARELKARVGEQRLDLVLADPGAYGDAAARLGDRAVARDPSRLVLGVPTDGSARHVRALLDEIDPAREAVAHFAVHEATLDDVFLTLTRDEEPLRV
jgi:ABC-2 type transport system ATP-binding protein